MVFWNKRNLFLLNSTSILFIIHLQTYICQLRAKFFFSKFFFIFNYLKGRMTERGSKWGRIKSSIHWSTPPTNVNSHRGSRLMPRTGTLPGSPMSMADSVVWAITSRQPGTLAELEVGSRHRQNSIPQALLWAVDILNGGFICWNTMPIKKSLQNSPQSR